MCVTLLTDFGTKDGFVGAMKGVILSINPGVPIVDITHEVEPFNILEGALILKAHYRYFPPGTVFIAVVDPGVGSERKPIALRLGDHFFVGPDNGIFDLVVKDFEGPPLAVVIKNKKLMLPRVNETFHGRDIFAPAGAYLSMGVPLKDLGREFTYETKLRFPDLKREGERLIGEIVYFDRFGNAITNIPCGDYSRGVFRGEMVKVVTYFQAGEKERLNLTCGSFGFMELFVPMKSARDELSLRLGEKVEVWLH